MKISERFGGLLRDAVRRKLFKSETAMTDACIIKALDEWQESVEDRLAKLEKPASLINAATVIGAQQKFESVIGRIEQGARQTEHRFTIRDEKSSE